MSFLTIPGQEGLFRSMKNGKSGEEADGRSPLDSEGNDAGNNDEEEEDEDPENVRLIPRCSPVPRKRGQSINDETAEYIRIHLGLSAGKRVSFADTTGGDLVDVKEFVAFDSDDEEASARWEEEEAKYRKPQREPTYQLLPEFRAQSGDALLQKVRDSKVEVEQVFPVDGEPLAVRGLVRVLNVSFHKSVYIRCTMDSWQTYFDHPADYVQGSSDGSTDQFSFKLSFAPPYITHGSRIEFVVRYETSDGDYWANNSSMNYVVTLLLSYEEDQDLQSKVDPLLLRGILKPPKYYSMNTDTDSEDEAEKEKEQAEKSKSELVRPRPMCPVIVQPEIDVEIASRPPDRSAPTNNQRLPSVDDTLSALSPLPGEHTPRTSSQTEPPSNSSCVPRASESVPPNKPKPSPRLHWEVGKPNTETKVDKSPSELSASCPPRQEEKPPSDSSSIALPTVQTSSGSITENGGSILKPAARPQCFAVASRERVEGLSEGSTTSASPGEASALRFPVPETPGAEGEAPPSSLSPSEPAAIPSVVTGVTGEMDGSSRMSTDGAEETSPAFPPDLGEERDVSGDLMPTAVFLSGVVSLSIAWQQPSALFLIGLLLILHRL